MPCYIYQLPSWVLDDLCRNMDTLSEWDWMHFASYVITDLTQLRKIKSMERVQGVSITRELLWWWGMRQATVQQLLDLLHHLELYRAAQIILNWKPVPEVKSPVPDFPAAEKSERPLAAPRRNPEDGVKEQPVTPATTPDPGPEPTRANLLPPCEDVPGSLKTPPSDSKNVSTSWPQPEGLLSLSEDSLSWREADVVQATNNFNQNHKIHEGAFADVYRGQRLGTPLIFKKIHEMTSGPGSLMKFFQAEVQLCRRCHHPNVLSLLGFCTGQQFCSLIYPYMANGSLQDRLQGQGDADSLSWPQRVHICSGLLRAVAHLHRLDIIHGNVKSSNVLLDQNFIPKLAHPVTHLCPVNKGSKCTTMKTRLFQASVAYLPEDFLRVGQLTKRVDIFSCGIVQVARIWSTCCRGLPCCPLLATTNLLLTQGSGYMGTFLPKVLAEVLTGIPAMDNSRSPVYLKDLLLGEIPGGGSSLCSRKTGMERAMAKEICQRYLETRAGHLQEDCAEALAMAACLCLRRRNTSLAEVCGWVATMEEQLGGQAASLPCSRLSEGTGSSSNTPEETDDVDLSSLGASSGAAPLPTCTEDRETEEGEGRLQAGGGVEADSSSEACASAKPPQDASTPETSWKIEINEAKRKLMENILLYKEEKLDSVELFGP